MSKNKDHESGEKRGILSTEQKKALEDDAKDSSDDEES